MSGFRLERRAFERLKDDSRGRHKKKIIRLSDSAARRFSLSISPPPLL